MFDRQPYHHHCLAFLMFTQNKVILSTCHLVQPIYVYTDIYVAGRDLKKLCSCNSLHRVRGCIFYKLIFYFINDLIIYIP